MKPKGKKRVIIFVILMLVLFVSSMAISNLFPQISNESDQDNDYISMGERVKQPKSDTKRHDHPLLYDIPESRWPRIMILGTASAVMMYVALIFGFVSFFIGYNAGGRLAKGKIIAAIATATTIAILSRSILIKVRLLIFDLFTDGIVEWNPLWVGTVLDIIFYSFTVAYVAAISVFIYETFTVTAKEAFSSR